MDGWNTTFLLLVWFVNFCLRSHITGDFAIFMDGRTFSGYGFVESATHWEREVLKGGFRDAAGGGLIKDEMES